MKPTKLVMAQTILVQRARDAAPDLCPHRSCKYYDERSEEYCSAPSFGDQIRAGCPDNTEIVPERRRGEPEGD